MRWGEGREEHTRTVQINFDTLFKVAYAGAFCKGELAYTAAEKEDVLFSSTHLLRRDVTFTRDADDVAQGVTIRLKSSTTDNQKVGVDIFIASTSSPCCAVRALETVFTRDVRDLDEPLFNLGKSHCSQYEVNRELQRRLVYLGIIIAGDRTFTGHSFRRGFATDAAANGVATEFFTIVRRWASDVYKRYVHFSLADRSRMSHDTLARTISSSSSS